MPNEDIIEIPLKYKNVETFKNDLEEKVEIINRTDII